MLGGQFDRPAREIRAAVVRLLVEDAQRLPVQVEAGNVHHKAPAIAFFFFQRYQLSVVRNHAVGILPIRGQAHILAGLGVHPRDGELVALKGGDGGGKRPADSVIILHQRQPPCVFHAACHLVETAVHALLGIRGAREEDRFLRQLECGANVEELVDELSSPIDRPFCGHIGRAVGIIQDNARGAEPPSAARLAQRRVERGRLPRRERPHDIVAYRTARYAVESQRIASVVDYITAKNTGQDAPIRIKRLAP